ncbi:MAG: competence/damage-inducible protein A [Oscillospiraceae bacterium]|jgi:nicotinamide-nucleotide amidase|nr:competence/damage-inducible protein A [Oscillospiraceae bacterium]
MTAELIAVGTELLLGGTANLDAQIISEKLSELGINVYYHTVVGDNDGRVRSAVEIAKSRADIIITTGGLGPTYDDMTKETLAAAFGKPLVLYPEEEARVRAWFSGVGFTFTDNNLRQAYFPEGSEILANPIGTAPGCAFESEGKHVIMLPGPPRECKKMMYEQAVPYLQKISGGSEIVSHTLFIYGMGESAVEDKLRDYMLTLNNPTLAPYAKPGEVQLRVTAKAATHAEAEAMIAPVVERVKATLGDMVYGVDIGSLENCVLKLLKERGKTLATAESMTGGLIAKRITDISGSSEVFRGGAVVYSDEAKIGLLDVAPETIAAHTAVSKETSWEMAVGATAKFGTDYAVAVTGFAEGEGNTFITVVRKEVRSDNRFDFKFDTREIPLGFDRDRSRTMAAHVAFDMLRRMIITEG